MASCLAKSAFDESYFDIKMKDLTAFTFFSPIC